MEKSSAGTFRPNCVRTSADLRQEFRPDALERQQLLDFLTRDALDAHWLRAHVLVLHPPPEVAQALLPAGCSLDDPPADILTHWPPDLVEDLLTRITGLGHPTGALCPDGWLPLLAAVVADPSSLHFDDGLRFLLAWPAHPALAGLPDTFAAASPHERGAILERLVEETTFDPMASAVPLWQALMDRAKPEERTTIAARLAVLVPGVELHRDTLLRLLHAVSTDPGPTLLHLVDRVLQRITPDQRASFEAHSHRLVEDLRGLRRSGARHPWGWMDPEGRAGEE